MLCRTRSAFSIRARVSCLKGWYPQWSNKTRQLSATGTAIGPNNGNGHDDHSRSGPRIQDGTERRHSFTQMGTIAARSPHTSIEQLLNHIPAPAPAPRGEDELRPNPALLSILLTPSFAQHALSSHLPLRILEHLGEDVNSLAKLDAITAVVDRLPTPNYEPEGVEGLAYLFTSAPGSFDPEMSTALQHSAQKPGWLSFELSPHPTTTILNTVQLPLASTVFSTGLPSTLIHSRYEVDAGDGELRLLMEKQLESQTLRMPLSDVGNTIDFSVPLIPLTPARTIMNSMGNIVRKLSPETYGNNQGQQSTNESISNGDSLLTASQELEAAVSDYFKTLQLDLEPVQVWALIVPSDLPTKVGKRGKTDLRKLDELDIRQSWFPRVHLDKDMSLQRLYHNNIMQLLYNGSRFCRVLSGGGGWGKKAGLISLDPDNAYSTRDLRHDKGWDFVFAEDDTKTEFDLQKRQALGDIVQEGDSIMFFLAPKRVKQDPVDILSSAGAGRDFRVVPGSDQILTLGVIPSRIDEITEPASNMENRSQESFVLANHYDKIFGMLSEGGMAIRTTKNGSVIGQSKLDFPFAKIDVKSLVADVRLQSPDGHSIYEENRSRNPVGDVDSSLPDGLRTKKPGAWLAGQHAEHVFAHAIGIRNVPNDFYVPVKVVKYHSEFHAALRHFLASADFQPYDRLSRKLAYDLLMTEREITISRFWQRSSTADEKLYAWHRASWYFLEGIRDVLTNSSTSHGCLRKLSKQVRQKMLEEFPRTSPADMAVFDLWLNEAND